MRNGFKGRNILVQNDDVGILFRKDEIADVRKIVEKLAPASNAKSVKETLTKLDGYENKCSAELKSPSQPKKQ